jgi:hypothetical protein
MSTLWTHHSKAASQELATPVDEAPPHLIHSMFSYGFVVSEFEDLIKTNAKPKSPAPVEVLLEMD